jgi:hypothetical protein
MSSTYIENLLRIVKGDINYIWLPTKTITTQYANYLYNPKVKRAFLLALNKDRKHVQLLNKLLYGKFIDTKYPEWDSEVYMLSQTEEFVIYKCKLTKKNCNPKQFIVLVQPKTNTVEIASAHYTIKSSK